MSKMPINRQNKSLMATLPAPTGGLNALDSWDKMPQTDALVMENYMPQETKVALRKGYQQHAQLPQSVHTLTAFKDHSGRDYLFAFASNSVYDVTSKQNVIDYKKNYSSDVFQTCWFKGRLFAVNGIDKPQTFYLNEENEGVWENANFSGAGLMSEHLINVASSKQRLWFVEKNTLKVWYTQNAGDIQGTLLSLDFSTIATKGGSLTAVACWTQDGGQGIDDLTVFITSEGEVLVYRGSDPNNPNDWSLKGVYKMARPIGYRSVFAYQGDLVIITEEGFMPLSKALPLQEANNDLVSFSNKIAPLVRATIQTNASKQGWEGIIYPRGGIALFNAPKENSFIQYVINLSTGAWCVFKGIRSYCWILFQGRLYFGTDNFVMLFDEGYSDNGVAIQGHIEQAYTLLNSPALKKIQLLNPLTKSSKKFALVFYPNTDFNQQLSTSTIQLGLSSQTLWNRSRWSSLASPSGTKWATLRTTTRSSWLATSATGSFISLVFKTSTKGTLIEWYGTGVRYELGLKH